MIDRIADVFGMEERWPFAVFFLALGGLMVGSILMVPLISLELTFGIFFLISFIVLGAAVAIDILIGFSIGTFIIEEIESDFIRGTIRFVFVVGALYGLYEMYSDVSRIHWESWGIREFYKSMGEGFDPFAWRKKSIFDPDIFPKLLHVWKALFANVGSVVIFFIYNMLAPWSWISTTIGIIKSD